MLIHAKELDLNGIPGRKFETIPQVGEITFTNLVFALVKAGSVIDEFWQAQQIERQIIFDPFPELRFGRERDFKDSLAAQGISCLCWSAITTPEVIGARVEAVQLDRWVYFRYRDTAKPAADCVYENNRLWWEGLPVLQADLKYSDEMTGGEDRTITIRLPRKLINGYRIVMKTI